MFSNIQSSNGLELKLISTRLPLLRLPSPSSAPSISPQTILPSPRLRDYQRKSTSISLHQLPRAWMEPSEVSYSPTRLDRFVSSSLIASFSPAVLTITFRLSSFTISSSSPSPSNSPPQRTLPSTPSSAISPSPSLELPTSPTSRPRQEEEEDLLDSTSLLLPLEILLPSEIKESLPRLEFPRENLLRSRAETQRLLLEDLPATTSAGIVEVVLGLLL